MISGKFEFKIDPIKEADKLKKGLRNKAIRIALNKAAGVVKEAVISEAPERYGYLKKSMKIKVKNYKNKDIWLAVVGPSSKYKRKKGKTKKGEPIYHIPSRYAHLLERGSKRMGKRPFLAPALQRTKSQFQQIFSDKLREQVNSMLRNAT